MSNANLHNLSIADDHWPAWIYAINNTQRLNRRTIAGVNFTDTAYDPESVYNTLKLFKKDQYAPEDLIVIQFNTVDFYPVGNNVPGIRLYNIFKCLAALDIPLWVIGFETNHYGISKFIRILSEKVCNDTVNMPSVVCTHYKQAVTPCTVPDIGINVDQIKFKYSLYAAGVSRPHRLSLLCKLSEDNLLDNGLLSWGPWPFKNEVNNNIDNYFNSTEKKISPTWILYLDPNFPIDLTSPWENSGISFLSTTKVDGLSHWHPYTELSAVTQKHQDKFVNFYRNPLISESPTLNGSFFENNFFPSMSSAFLYVAAETVFDYPCSVFTEKTFRPLYHKRPFVVLGAPGTLKILKEVYGFKTYGQWWDESYDDELDPNERFKKVYGIIKQINSMSIDQLKELCNNMQETIEYNFNHYRNVFANDEVVANHLYNMVDRKIPYV